MLEHDFLQVAMQGLILVLILSLPAIITAAVMGVLIGLLQAITQVQDQTLAFAFKVIATVLVIYFSARWVGLELHTFSQMVFDKIKYI